MIITCPYCHKKMRASRWRIILKGRLSIGCPGCGRAVYGSKRKQLATVQMLTFLAVLALFGGVYEGGLDLSQGKMLLTVLAFLVLLMVLGDRVSAFIAQDKWLEAAVRRELEEAKAQEAARKKAEAGQKKKKKK